MTDSVSKLVARALLRAGQSQHIGQALLTTGAVGWLTLSSDKVFRPSLPGTNKVTHPLIPVVGRLISTPARRPLKPHRLFRDKALSDCRRRDRRLQTSGPAPLSSTEPYPAARKTKPAAAWTAPDSEGELSAILPMRKKLD